MYDILTKSSKMNYKDFSFTLLVIPTFKMEPEILSLEFMNDEN